MKDRTTEICLAVSPDGGSLCFLYKNHLGPHEDEEILWSSEYHWQRAKTRSREDVIEPQKYDPVMEDMLHEHWLRGRGTHG